MPSHTKTKLVHEALFYGDPAEYVRGVGEFVGTGLRSGEPVMVAVPGPRLELLRDELGDKVELADMAELGRNPARIIPRIRAFVDAHPGRRVRFVGEPIWVSRTGPELIEGTRHEALINLAFADAPATILCPYDTAGLGEGVLTDAECTHPVLVAGGERRPSAAYLDPLDVYDVADRPLPEAPRSAVALPTGADLAGIRAFVRRQSTDAGLAPERAADLLLAANEVATNTLVHVARPGEVRFWSDGREVVCEIADSGRIRDPLVGRVVPGPDRPGGRGLWLVNQLCDLVELRSGAEGTVIRLHMRLS